MLSLKIKPSKINTFTVSNCTQKYRKQGSLRGKDLHWGHYEKFGRKVSRSTLANINWDNTIISKFQQKTFIFSPWNFPIYSTALLNNPYMNILQCTSEY